MGLGTWGGGDTRQEASPGDLGTRGTVNRALATRRVLQLQKGPRPLLPGLCVIFTLGSKKIPVLRDGSETGRLVRWRLWHCLGVGTPGLSELCHL